MLIRPLTPRDLAQVLQISLLTGDAGRDATELYEDHRLVGQIYAAPYARLYPKMCLVAQDDTGVAGFVVGAVDTVAFAGELEARWWPGMRAIYPEPDQKNHGLWGADQKRHQMIHHPVPTPGVITQNYPAHMHLNLLPRAQGLGVGRQLLERWLGLATEAGARAVHVGVNRANRGGLAFWQACGFDRLNDQLQLPADAALWLGREI